MGRFWQGIGIYALPGQVVEVTLPASVVSLGNTNIHIGGWTDKLYRELSTVVGSLLCMPQTTCN